MLVLGIDPGLAVTGYGLVAELEGKLVAVEFGAIRTKPSKPLQDRMYEIVELLSEVIEEHRPDCASVEKIFVAVNIKTALLLGHVRGAILTCLRQHKLTAHEYSPLEIKQAVVGYGRAEKRQVAEMVRMLLSLSKPPTPADAADALAAAICHLHVSSTSLLQERVKL